MPDKKTIALLGALDTKGEEYAWIKEIIQGNGFSTLLIDVGVLGEPAIAPDVTHEEVARAGGAEVSALAQRQDRGEAVACMSRGAAILLPALYAEGRFDGVIAMGGSGGTSVACNAMRALPLGVPKLMVSTVAGSDVSGYVGISDIVMVPSIVDVAGINRVSREVFTRAAGAICGMVSATISAGDDRPLIAATMFGNTTPAVEHAKKIFENAGYEVLVFHCTGAGGKTMEALVEAGMFSGVFDFTTTEWADEVVGGLFSAGSDRLSAAARKGVPAIVVPGCLDMANFGAPDTVPEKYRERKFYPHNPNVTLMRTNVEENMRMGELIAERLNSSDAAVTVLLPKKGVSMIDAPDGPFWWPEANSALYDSLRKCLRDDIPVIEMDCNINDEAFSEKCAAILLDSIRDAG